MLRQGARRLDSAADYPARGLSLFQGDARHIPLRSGWADFALVGGNGSFNHLDDAGARASLAELHRALRGGGGLGLELINSDLLQEISPQRSFAPFRSPPPGVSVVKTVSNRYDRQESRFHIHQVTRYEIAGEGGQFEESFALRVWQPEEARSLLESAGFQDLRFYGGHNLEAFDRWSSDLLLVAVKPYST
jgi:SAM-dependent methyltransferase